MPLASRVRPPIIALLLVAAMVPTAELAYQAYRAEERHRQTTGTVLHDYAALAADELAARVLQELDYYGASPLLGFAAQHLAREGALPDTTMLAGTRRLAQPGRLVDAFAAYEVDAGRLRVSGTVPPHVATWVRERLDSAARAPDDSAARFSTAFAPTDSTVLFSTRYRTDRGGSVVLAVISDRRRLATAVQSAIARRPLLPATLTGGADADSAAVGWIELADGSQLIPQPHRFPPTFIARSMLADHFGGMTAVVSVDPELAGTLSFGGRPDRRLPWLIALAVLGAGLIGAALLLWRQEQAVARLRTDFVSGVSHELRTPLAQIRMFAETLLLGRVRTDGERRRSLTIIDQEARRLTHLVENLLYFSRHERHLARVDPRRIPLKATVADTVASFRPLAGARRTEVRLTASEEVWAVADADGVRQMLLNLLDNAVKYGPEGQTVIVTVARDEAGRPTIGVADEGPGVPPAARPLVWRRFWRGNDGAGSVTGTGIGLAIVRELADLQGAEAWVEGNTRGGAHFVIAWPVEDG